MLEDGSLLAYKMLQLQRYPEVRECEALALLKAISWVHSMGYERVIF